MAVTYEQFKELDIRVAKVLSAESIPGRTRIMKGTVDAGSGTRQVIIGGAEHWTPEQMVGRTVIIVANLEPRTVAGVQSEAMLLAADVDGKPFWLSAGDTPEPGSRVL